MLWATVPEAAINEDGNASFPMDEVWISLNAARVLLNSKDPSLPQPSSKRPFELRPTTLQQPLRGFAALVSGYRP